MLITALAGCANDTDTPAGSTAATNGTTAPATDDPNQDPDPEPDPKPSISGTKFALNNTATWAKLLDPRMEATADYITCDWSASGIEFTATFGGDVTFEVNANTKMGGGKEGCYFRAYIDGAVYKNGESDYYTVKGDSQIVLKNVPQGTHTVRLVKASGYTLANVDLKNVYLNGTVADTAPATKELFIEFVGDSISCGWGVVGSYDGAYTSQDATLAYPYLIADTLNADYSVVALSGQGIIKGNPGIANGYKYASPFRSKTTEYAFARKANVVVINADTNDAYDNYPVANYLTALKEFVEYVRTKNGPDTHIILVCNMMKVLYTESIEGLVKELGGAESKYYYYKGTTAAGVHTSHPTAEENVTYASELGGMIKAILEGTYTEEVDPPAPDTPTIPVNKTPIYTQNFDNVTTAAEAGIVNLYGGTMAPTIVNGKLSIPSTAWGDSTPDPFVQLVGRDVFAGAPGKYMIEMDVEASKLGVFGLILNGKTDSAHDNKYGRENAILVTLRLGKGVDQLTHGTLAEKAAEYDLWLRSGHFDASKAQKTYNDNDKFICEIAEGATSVSVKLTVVINSTLADGCQVEIYANGVYIYGYTLDNNYDVTANSYISLWVQDAIVTIDNVVVSTFD